MQSAAVNIVYLNAERTGRAFLAWRRELARFIAAEGFASTLEHVTESEWFAWFTFGEDPESAALDELDRCSND